MTTLNFTATAMLFRNVGPSIPLNGTGFAALLTTINSFGDKRQRFAAFQARRGAIQAVATVSEYSSILNQSSCGFVASIGDATPDAERMCLKEGVPRRTMNHLATGA